MKLVGKELLLEQSDIIETIEFTNDSIEKKFIVKGGKWWVEDGALIGENKENLPAIILSKMDYHGNIMLDFEAATILPCTHDINAMIQLTWDEEKDLRGLGYVAGIQGWWNGKTGIEKSPQYKLNVMTPLFQFVPGQKYRIQFGSIEGHIFLIVDHELILEIMDPDPINHHCGGRIGFEAYCSKIRIENVMIRGIAYKELEETYTYEGVSS